MSVDEMEFYINEYFPIPCPATDKIIAALRAGQEMYKDLDDNEAGYTAGQAAWDAATREDG